MALVVDRQAEFKAINFQFLNRQLLWDAVKQFFLFIVTVMDRATARRALDAMARMAASSGAYMESSWRSIRRWINRDDGDGFRTSENDGSNEHIDDEGTTGGVQDCAACGCSPAATPYVTACGHTFCYYCLKTACMDNENYCCARCNFHFAWSKPWTRIAH